MQKESSKSRSFQDLEVWKLAMELAKEIYQITGKFPQSEKFGLTNQIRRASVSIPSNIAEGQGRNSAKEFRQFLSISLGSLAELETQLILSKEINLLTTEELNPLLFTLDRIRKMVKSLSRVITP